MGDDIQVSENTIIVMILEQMTEIRRKPLVKCVNVSQLHVDITQKPVVES